MIGRRLLRQYNKQRNFNRSNPLFLRPYGIVSARFLSTYEDHFSGIFVNLNQSEDGKYLTANGTTHFLEDIKQLIETNKKEGKNAMWLRIPESCVALVSPAVSTLGFHFHHASPSTPQQKLFDEDTAKAFNGEGMQIQTSDEEGYVMLNKFLGEKEEDNRLPDRGSYFLGVAGFCLNKEGNKVLMIKEKSGPAAKLGIWKLPGGLADQHESLDTATVREVKEETGVDTNFLCVSSIQEIHHVGVWGGNRGRSSPSRLGASDLYVISVVQALEDDPDLIPQQAEIQDVAWISKDIAMGQEFVQNSPVFQKVFSKAFSLGERSLVESSSTITTEKGAEGGLRSELLDFGFRRGKCKVFI
eukprot:g1619.t1